MSESFSPQSGQSFSIERARLELGLEGPKGPNRTPFGRTAALIKTDVSPEVYSRLGGTLKMAKILSELPNDWPGIESYLAKTIPEHGQYIEGKLNFGISVYGLRFPVKSLQKSLLTFKKNLKNNDKSVRVILNKNLELSTAEVYHNKLTGKNGWELLVVTNGQKTFLAQTLYVQDIDSYVLRDRGRPKRDTRVGMLPPKLAQTILNLAGASTYRHPMEIKDQTASGFSFSLGPFTILDPFCGTGVVLQEASLMGLSTYGTDKELRMIEYSKANVDWLDKTFNLPSIVRYFEVGDATSHTWKPVPSIVAGETYLGPPLTRQIPEHELAKMIHSVNKLHEAFLKNLSVQIKTGTRICLAVPAWRRRQGYEHLPVLEKLPSLGYNWVEFEHVDGKKLIYDREGQFVARQLVTITKN